MRIALISDFFHPRTGGVETHQLSLARALVQRGHYVIAITGVFSNTQENYHSTGIRWINDSIKVYHLPLKHLVATTSFPTFILSIPMLRRILIDECIEIVHSHQSTSTLAIEGLILAKQLRIATVFTEHSLFGFADLASIHLNKVLAFALSQADQVITVSNTCKENIVLRAQLAPEQVFVIPNAIDPEEFQPTLLEFCAEECVNIVLINRLVFRKGMDLVMELIPKVCRARPRVRFIIGGDGPKWEELQEMIRVHQLEGKVELLGLLYRNQVSNVLKRGHVFLSCSLTESFCIAILEAVSSGLCVVSTNVGGIHEILPSNLLKLAPPNPTDMFEALVETIDNLSELWNPLHRHKQIRSMYSWPNIAERTERVYAKALEKPIQSISDQYLAIINNNGFLSSILYSGIIFLVAFFCALLRIWEQMCRFASR